MTLRRAFRSFLLWFHRWLGLALAVYVVLLSVTGGLLVFRTEIERMLEPAVFTSDAVSPETHAPLSTLLAAASAAAPEAEPDRVRYPTTSGGVVEVRLYNDDDEACFAYLDPVTADVRDVRAEHAGVMGFLFALHVYLLAGELGHQINGWLGIACLVLFCTGAVLWLPRKLRSVPVRLMLRLRGPWSARLYSLHTVGGLYAMPWLIVVFLTGVMIVFPIVTDRVIVRVTGTPIWPAIPGTNSTGPALPLDELLARADAEAIRLQPGAIVAFVFPPSRPGRPFRTMHRTADSGDEEVAQISLDPVTGELLAADRLGVGPAGHRIYTWISPLHYGTWGGLASRVLQVAFSVVAVFVTAGGVWLFCHRTLSRRARVRRMRVVGRPVGGGTLVEASQRVTG